MMVIIFYITLWRSLIKPAMSLLLVVVVTGSTSGVYRCIHATIYTVYIKCYAILVFYVLTIQSPSSGCSSCLFLCVIWGSNGSQVLQMKWNHTNITGISDIQPINGQYLIQKAKLGVFLLWVFTSRIRSFFHQKNITLFTLEPEKTDKNLIHLLKSHLKRTITLLVCTRILPLFLQCCWAKWPFLASDELSYTPSTCRWMVWYPAEKWKLSTN